MKDDLRSTIGARCLGLLLLLLLCAVELRAQSVKLIPSEAATNSPIATNMWVAVPTNTTCYEISVYNGSASTLYLFAWDSNTNKPTNEPYEISPVPIPANSSGGHNWRSNGRVFRRGVTIACSTTPLTWTNGGMNFQITVEHTR